MEFRVLGSLAAVADGAAADLGPPKQRALLAILLMHAGDIVPVDRLIDLLWGEGAPRTAAHSIQIYVSELRKALEPLAGREIVVTRPPGYVLEVDSDSIDARLFERLVHEGARMLQRGDSDPGRATLRRALELWRGPPLSDFAYEEFAQPHIRRLNDLRLDGLEALAAAELDAGHPEEAMPLLTSAVQEDPLRERACELLMVALYRSGRHADALRTYQELRAQLAGELGIDPSPQVRALYDRILLHDPSLLPSGTPSARNPYKGLRPFTEADAEDFFGRDDLVDRLVTTLGEGARLIALVGPSGSGKSSVVAAGLVPRLRDGAVPGSEHWRIVRMTAGLDPLREAHAALRRARTERGAEGPDDGLLLVLDQFEQVFTADEAARNAFLDALAAAVREPDGPLRVVLTLRADFYDRPLLHPAFASVFAPAVVNVIPMTPLELEAAVVEPARRVGVSVESPLLAELVADSIGRPGSLPILQYALTELFERRSGATLTGAEFARLGGLRGLVSRRAESLYAELGGPAQEAAEQVFLRLVRPGPGSGAAESRRRVALAELSDLDIDPVVLSEVLTAFGRQRLLTFDRDALTDQATAEVAHEALLSEWDRLAGWIEQHRDDLRRHRALVAGAEEWVAAGRNPDYLFTGSRLDEFEPWLSHGPLQLSGTERAFLEAAVDRRRAGDEAATIRAQAEQRAARRARNRFVALAVAVFVLGAALTFAILLGIGGGSRRVGLLIGEGAVDELAESGFDHGVSDFALVALQEKIGALSSEGEIADAEERLRALSEQGPALVVVFPVFDVGPVAAEFPDTLYLHFGSPGDEPNMAGVAFREWEGAYLAGVAAGLTTETDRIGFIGGWDFLPVWGFQAGFAAGATRVNPGVQVRTEYATDYDDESGFRDAGRVEQLARDMYAWGADVVFHAAGQAGLGLFEAAAALSDANHHLWAIGVDSDQYESVLHLPGVTNAEAWQPHILTSVLKRFDQVIYDALEDIASGSPPPVLQVHDLETRMVDISYAGGFLEEHRDVIEGFRGQIIRDEIVVPCIPSDRMFLIEQWAEEAEVTPEAVIASICP